MHPQAQDPSLHEPVELTCTAIVPARYHSSRLPGKPLAEICGHPMIEHVYRRAAAAPSVSQVLVATDDARIVTAVERFGGSARMTRGDHASGSDRLAEVAAQLDCDLVVNVQGDEPLLDPRMIEEAIAPFRQDPGLQMGTLRRAIADPDEYLDPNVVKVVVDRQDFALYFSRWPIPYIRHAGLKPCPTGEAVAAQGSTTGAQTLMVAAQSFGPAYKHVGLYVYRREFLLAFARLDPTPLERAESLEQLRALEHGFRIKAVETRYDSLGVDTPEDLERARRQLAGASRE